MTVAGANAVKKFAVDTPKFQGTDVVQVLGEAEKQVVIHHMEVFGTKSI